MVHAALLALPVGSEDWWTYYADATLYGHWVKYWRITLEERGLTLAVGDGYLSIDSGGSRTTRANRQKRG